jgi:hypothetical protein
MAHLQLVLDDTVEADLTSQANARGVEPEQLAAQLVETGLRSASSGNTLQNLRTEAIKAMKNDRKGRLLGLNGMSAREFAHTDHKY